MSSGTLALTLPGARLRAFAPARRAPGRLSLLQTRARFLRRETARRSSSPAPPRSASRSRSLCLCAILYIPLAGNYGLWDPWETHYGEVARQMAQRNDWISLWWPGSPHDRARVLVQARAHLLADGAVDEAVRPRVGARAGERDGRRSGAPSGRCACRGVLLSLASIWAVWQLVHAARRDGAPARSPRSSWRLVAVGAHHAPGDDRHAVRRRR